MLYLWVTMLLSVGCNIEDADLFGVFRRVSLEVDQNIVVTEGASVVEIHYQLEGVRESSDDSNKQQMSFAWSTEDITARRGVDFNVTPHGALGLSGHQADGYTKGSEGRNIYSEEIFSGGATTGKISISLLGDDDDIYEGDKHFKFVISSPSLNNIEVTNSILESMITIKDNDPAPSIRISDVTVSEGSQYAEVSYALSFRSGIEASFSWETVQGSAREVDYQAIRSQNLTIPAGSTTGVLRVFLINDNIDEDAESFQVVINANSLQGIGASDSILQATVTITDDDIRRASDSFTQKKLNNKVDIVWVIDNSNSMANDQSNLSNNFSSLINNFINGDGHSSEQNLDFKMAIITTDNDRNVAKDLRFKLKVASGGVFRSLSDKDNDNINIGRAATSVALRYRLASINPVVTREHPGLVVITGGVMIV